MLDSVGTIAIAQRASRLESYLRHFLGTSEWPDPGDDFRATTPGLAKAAVGRAGIFMGAGTLAVAGNSPIAQDASQPPARASKGGPFEHPST
jgi:hypothetical protein